MVDGVRASVKDAFEGEEIDVVVNADRPQRSEKPVRQNHVDGNGQEIAAGENRHCLNEGIQRVEGEASERSHCLGFVVDEMQVPVYFGVVQKAVEPIGEKLIVCDVQQQVERQHGVPAEGVLRFGKIGIAEFDQIDQWRLAEDVQRRPLEIVPVALSLVLQLLLARSEPLLPPHVQHQVGKPT